MAVSKKELAGGWPHCLSPGRCSTPADKEGAGRISCRGKLIYSIKEALYLCMDIHMHEFPARFIFFINMQTRVQALQNTDTEMRDYII